MVLPGETRERVSILTAPRYLTVEVFREPGETSYHGRVRRDTAHLATGSA